MGCELEEKLVRLEFYQSPLFEKIRDYLTKYDSENKTIFIFVPFIKTRVFKKLVENLHSKIVVITTWDTKDILAGSSELDLYPFCKEKGISLYINNEIHLKVFSIGLKNMIVSTGNISERGMNEGGNYECGVLISRLSNHDRMFFESIRQEALLVNEILYKHLVDWYQKQVKRSPEKNQFDEFVISVKHEFLISALPMTRDVKIFEDAYQKINEGRIASDDDEINDSVFHDLANYKIPLKLSNDDFKKQLRISFFSHPFIKKIDEFISPEAYFGRIKEWIQNNCTDVPVPSRRELTGNVQVLLEWFTKLGDGKYVVDIPGEHSQRIRRVRP